MGTWALLGRGVWEAFFATPDPRSPVERFVKPAFRAVETVHDATALFLEVPTRNAPAITPEKE